MVITVSSSFESGWLIIFIEWEDTLSVGIDSIDNQHRHLIDLINNLYTTVISSNSHLIIGPLLIELLEYVYIHILTEEAYFDKYQFPDKIAHSRLHTEFIHRIYTLQEHLSNANKPITIDDIKLIKDWFILHIMKQDIVYATFIKNKLT